MTAPRLIALDWGTTSLRAYLLDGAGQTLQTQRAAGGILAVPEGAFDTALEAAIGPWLDAHGDLALIACGMIGSRQGWKEAPYRATPAGLADLARELITVTTHRGQPLHIAAGVNTAAPDGTPDVMRGEETQLMGALASGDSGRCLWVLPGTHSKWALVEGGRITWFATFMTGELFAVLCKHSILGRLMGEEESELAFATGVQRGLHPSPGQGSLRQLFSARTLALFDMLPPDGARSYLSGVLLGGEIREALADPVLAGMSEVRVLGGAALAAAYSQAIEEAGLRAILAAEDAAATGLWRIAGAAGLV